MANETNPWASTEETGAADVEQTDPWGSSEVETAAPDNPWGVTEGEAAAADNPWGETAAETTEVAEPVSDWLSAGVQEEQSFSLLNPFDNYTLPLQEWVESGLGWLVENFRGVFQAIRAPLIRF